MRATLVNLEIYMVFSSHIFLLMFLPAVVIINFILPPKFRNIFLLAANLIFYAYGEPVYVLLMLASIWVNYAGALYIDKTSSYRKRKAMLVLNVILNIGALCFFKYTVLLMDTLRIIPALKDLPAFNIVLPIGISFYTFQAMSYVIDVYRGDCRSSKSFVEFAAYISLFPQLIAGPIVRYTDVERKLRERHVSYVMFSNGVKLFIIGLCKKVLLANQFGMVWEEVSQSVGSFGTIGAWVGAFAYTLQIYFDFAGYSDMARGLGKMLGFDFCINFSYPYISRSITEFWRRWHISLSTWFKDYVYIPLGGNRKGILRQILNILIVWALTGLWHGAGWNFVAWGVYYGVLLILEKLVYGKLLSKMPKTLCHVYTLLIVVVGWIFFASPTFADAFCYLKAMVTLNSASAVSLMPHFTTFAIGIVAATPLGAAIWGTLRVKCKTGFAEIILCIIGFVLCMASLITESYNPFLYFRF
jgi:alginate O-acetyltransferase complex protein AlgI